MKRVVLEAVALLALAVVVRVGAAWVLGPGAPFGPDGTGLDAAVQLGGHPYPLNVALISVFGTARVTSLVFGSLSCLLLWALGRRLGLGGAGGWLAATLPLAVYTSALSGGDAPALAVVLTGALLATAPGWIAPILGGALAATCVAIKPVVLPALLLLLVRPRALIGLLALLPLAPWVAPLVQPRPGGGLLGTWWVASGGAPPVAVSDWLSLFTGGFAALLTAPAWALSPLVLLPLGLVFARGLDRPARVAAVVPALAALAIAAAFGDRLEPRYLTAAVVIALPWCGALLPRWLVPVAAFTLSWPTAAVLTQVAAERRQRDPSAEVPDLPVVEVPPVDARALFDEASIDGATALRHQAIALAQSLPEGASIQVRVRRDGREGELVWPLAVLRPDVRVELVGPDEDGL